MRPLALCVALSAAATCAGQLRFVDPGTRHLPPVFVSTGALAVGDVNGDGHLDVVVGNAYSVRAFERDAVLLGDGKGAFRRVPLPRTPVTTRAIVLADLDGDRDLDLVLGGVGGSSATPSQLLLNDGRGGFRDVTATHWRLRRPRVTSLTAFDADGDGDLDLFAGGMPLNTSDPASSVWLNDGKGRMTEVQVPWLAVSRSAAGDVDKDGDVDLLLVNPVQSGSGVKLWLNDGRGRFTEKAGLPAIKNASDLAVADVDRDGDLDAVVATSKSLADAWHSRLWLGDGKGGFTDASGQLPRDADQDTSVLLEDLDGDGSPDIYFCVGDGQDRRYVNNGRGIFQDVTARALPQRRTTWTSVARSGDFDGDGRSDLFVGAWGPNHLFLGDGTRGFRDASPLPEIKRPEQRTVYRDVVVADFDGNGFDDIYVIAQNFHGEHRLLLSDGTGALRDGAARVPKQTDPAVAGTAIDADGDGDVDLVLALGFGNTVLYRNGPNGFVRDAAAFPVGRTGWGLTAGDVDGDGDADVMAFNGLAPTPVLFLNDGRGVFRDATKQLPGLVHRVRDVCLFDADGDGDLDAYVGTDKADQLWSNDGRGKFTVASNRLPATSYPVQRVVSFDADRDGDLDVVLGNLYQNALLLNDGRGRFTDATSRLPVESTSTWDVLAGDLTGDGIRDLYFANGDRAAALQGRLLAGDGRAGFTDVTARSISAHAKHPRTALIDLDADGDVDLVQIDGMGRLLVNRTRQVTITRIPTVGQVLPVEIAAHAGSAPRGQVAVPFVRIGRVPSFDVAPFGRWWLGAGGFVAVPAVALPSPSGVVTLPLPVPRLAALLGQELGAQALVLHGAAARDWRLSNASFERIR